MKMRIRRKQFWWTWRVYEFIGVYSYNRWSVGRIKHQIKEQQ